MQFQENAYCRTHGQTTLRTPQGPGDWPADRTGRAWKQSNVPKSLKKGLLVSNAIQKVYKKSSLKETYLTLTRTTNYTADLHGFNTFTKTRPTSCKSKTEEEGNWIMWSSSRSIKIPFSRKRCLWHYTPPYLRKFDLRVEIHLEKFWTSPPPPFTPLLLTTKMNPLSRTLKNNESNTINQRKYDKCSKQKCS